MRLETSSWTDVDEASPTTALLPVGSTEQHGPHAPVGTDTFVARAIADAADRESDAESIVGPTIPVGIAPYHGNFPGTCSVSAETFRRYVRDVVESIADSSVETVVFVNGHGGNGETLSHLAREVTAGDTIDCEAYLWEWMRAVDEHVGHAGELETAVLLHLRPDDVGDPVAGDAATWADTVDGGVVRQFTDEFSENGAVGDATEASPEQGERVFETAVDALVSFLERVRSADGDEGREPGGSAQS
ncbi:creatininase family protein [Haloterrigena sp. SYSU A558-1]|uniref:Creatininase family protein n=1 Tax=Haloterrigena gelatinilytica TaxID=2741724 RepID=A0A8J8GMZ3_9EURY|nr:creatininase family protein [Haloterrigena gelatinilytica]NUB92656.1 creatininase family protein [Haloterrigena gelatinilytica]NUC71428.1 creatininase family protein [Haloterrigena gelatinilytica]